MENVKRSKENRVDSWISLRCIQHCMKYPLYLLKECIHNRMYKAIILHVVPNLFSQRKHFVFGGEN